MDVDLLLEVDATYAMEAARHPAVRGGAPWGMKETLCGCARTRWLRDARAEVRPRRGGVVGGYVI
jgi:hypothetical protein